MDDPGVVDRRPEAQVRAGLDRLVAAGLRVLEPESPVLGALIGGFVPQLLFGVVAFDPASGAPTLALAQDQDQSGLPGPDTELTLPATLGAGSSFAASAPVYTVAVHDATGERKGDLAIAPFGLGPFPPAPAAAVLGATSARPPGRPLRPPEGGPGPPPSAGALADRHVQGWSTTVSLWRVTRWGVRSPRRSPHGRRSCRGTAV